MIFMMGLVKITKSTARLVLLGLTLGLLLTGCLQNGKAPGTSGASASAGASSTSGGLPRLSGGTLPPGASATAINLLNAFRSNIDPTGTLDLIGTSGEIGTYCPSTSSCQCRLSWTENGSPLQVDAPPLYVETDLMRCSYAAATSAPNFSIHIVVLSGGLSSNSFTLTNNYRNAAVDHTENANFLKVLRYQCRDIVQRNTDLYGGTLLDPQVWNISYTFNLFTTSLGKDYGYTAPGYECPLVPTNMLSTPFTSTDGIYDMNVYSVAPLGGDSTIYPSGDTSDETLNQNRHDFYLASFYDGTFRQPFCVPHTVSSSNNSLSGGALDCSYDSSSTPARVGRDVIGYAAVPDSGENCPGPSIAIPSQKKWAKVWQLRASLPSRSVINIANADGVGDLFCTTTDHEWTGNAASTSNGVDRYAQGAMYAHNIGAIGLASSSGMSFGNCSGSSCSSTDGTAKYFLRSGYGNTTGATCAATTRDGFCTTPNGEFSASYPFSTTNGAPGLRHGGGQNGGIGVAFSSASVDGYVSVPSNAARGKGGTTCNPTLPGDFWSYGFGGNDVWLVGNGTTGACIEADTNALGIPFNDKSNAYVSHDSIAPYSHPIKNWFDFLGVTCPGTGDCSTLPSVPLVRANNSPVTSWGGYGAFQFSVKTIDTSSSADMMYVVTPTTVTRTEMNDTNNSTFMQYQPYRYINGAPVYYFIDSGSLNTTVPSQRLPVFPLCILQEKP